MTIQSKKALVIGGSSGSGREIALRLAESGVDTTVVARDLAKLETLKSANPNITVLAEDAASEGSAARLLSEHEPDLLILSAGHAQPMAPFFEQSWEAFSGAWNIDTKIAHAFLSAAITLPMASGSTIINFSSGAGLSGSRLSGGYAGAKRMQHFLTEYAQKEAALRNLDLNFYSIIPKQLIAETELGQAAGQAYAEANGKTLTDFMNQWEQPLTAKKISDYIIELLVNKEAFPERSYFLTGTGIKAGS